MWALRKLIFVFSLLVLGYGLLRHEPPPNLFANSDKYLHALAFAGFSLCARVAFDQTKGWLLWPLLMLVAVGSEWLQNHLQPTRHFSLADIQANALGIGLALVLWQMIAWLRRR